MRAILAGSFDPLTNGHLDLIRRGVAFCGDLIIAIGVNPAKKTLFSVEERLSLINHATFINGLSTSTLATSFDGLLVEHARLHRAKLLLRGIRGTADLEYEMTLAQVNKMLAPEIDTVFLPTSPELSIVSSSAVKEIARNGGNFDSMVPSFVAAAIKEKLNTQQ